MGTRCPHTANVRSACPHDLAFSDRFSSSKMSQPHLKLPKAQASETLHDNNDNDPCGMVLSDRASFVNSCFKGLVCGGRLTRGNCDRGQNLINYTYGHAELQSRAGPGV